MRGVQLQKLDVGTHVFDKVGPQGVVHTACSQASQLVVKITPHFPLYLKLSLLDSHHKFGHSRVILRF